MKVQWQVKSPDVRVAARQETSAAVVADLYKLWQDTLPRISGKSKLAEAIRYALSRREAFEHVLHDGRVEIDSNIVERAIRPQAIVRKNSLFAGNAGGGRTWATLSRSRRKFFALPDIASNAKKRGKNTAAVRSFMSFGLTMEATPMPPPLRRRLGR